MDLPSTFKDIAPFLQHPLVLIGFVVLLFFGILTALLKAGILPQLSRTTAGDLAKRVINYGFIIALLVIGLGFWLYSNDHGGEKSRGEKPEASHDTIKPIPPTHSARIDSPKTNRTYCRVTLLIPSELNTADIFVDGRPADILEQKLTSVVLRMEKKNTSQKITLRNSFRECSTRVLIDGDKQLQACM